MLKLLIVFLGIIFSGKANSSFHQMPKPKTVMILSIDGGGVRGIVPAIILRAIEKKLPIGTSLKNYFHIMSGTSTGALICLLLNKPGNFENAPYTMNDIIRIYYYLSQKVFSVSYFHRITSFWGLKSAKYDAKNLEDCLSNYLGYTKLSESTSALLIPAFDLRSRRMKFFSTNLAKRSPHNDFYLKDIARATSSAPTYFEAACIRNVSNFDEGVYVDGGVGVNNPTIAAIVHSIELYGKNTEIFVLSIGTGTPYSSYDDNINKLNLDIKDMGKIDWASYIIDVLMDANSQVAHYQALVGLGPKYYYRIQMNIDSKAMDLDDGTPEHMEELTQLTNAFVIENERLIAEIAETLVRLDKRNAISLL